ncbi:hypothetical protein B0H17DRAFT_928511 [Mycena rosella]|uniref:C2H2-type domain-containing protein n=1 Tax=Mycena rosella TaxID=1033263 RepID=A0AAD7DR52_MYCRO|nr:hypothetical protein B0H17DRAFT_928511 [Mycena rosella]
MPRAGPPSSSQAVIPETKRRPHVCADCDKSFTTSGHLVRHVRIHTGEVNHSCPFPGCMTRCARKDNLGQQ